MRKIALIALFVFTVLLSFNIFAFKDKLYKSYNVFLGKIYGIREDVSGVNDVCKLNFYSLSLNALLYENKELKELLRYKTENSVLAKVIDRHIEKSFYILDSQAKPEKKYIAISTQGYALGFSKDNFLLLFSMPGRVINTYAIKEDKKISIQAEALMSGSFKAEVNKEFKIKVGDKIYFDLWPIGIVYSVENIKNSPYDNVYIALPFNLSNLSNVLLIEYE